MNDWLEAMRANPFGKWRIKDVEAVCADFGVFCETARGGSSHYKVAHPRMPAKLSTPFARRIKRVYIRQLVRFPDDGAKLT